MGRVPSKKYAIDSHSMKMRAMVLEKGGSPLVLREVAVPIPDSHQVLIRVSACGVCRTDLHIVDGDLPDPKLPLILGHQIVGQVTKIGSKVSKLKEGDRVGIPWLGGCCQTCDYCLEGNENLCDTPLFTGYQQNGGFAEYCVANEDFIIKIPENHDDIHTAPLLCAGLIGFRAFQQAATKKNIGFYGFGSSAHILIQVARKLGQDVYVFTRPGDTQTQKFALSLGAKWAGGSDELPPIALEAAILFAPVGDLFPQALQAVKKGGRVVSAGIHMSDIPSFPYALLWGERSMSSVANLTRQDGIDFFNLIEKIPLKTFVKKYSLEEANQALEDIRKGTLEGSAVLEI